MKHSQALELAKLICGPKAFVLLSATAGALRYRVCLRAGTGLKIFAQGKSWEDVLQRAASRADEEMREARLKNLVDQALATAPKEETAT